MSDICRYCEIDFMEVENCGLELKISPKEGRSFELHYCNRCFKVYGIQGILRKLERDIEDQGKIFSGLVPEVSDL